MTKRILPLLLFMMAILPIGGIYATWLYAGEPIRSAEQNFGMSISVFDYTPQEILPGGDLEDPEIGQNHLALIDLILYEDDKGYGLNISDNVVLHRYLDRQEVVYSNQKVSGGNLKFILDPSNNTHGLYYCIEKISDTEYWAYTFSTDDLVNYGGQDVEIVAYKTILVKSQEWTATSSYYGYAKTKPLSRLGVSSDPNAISYSIDVSTWHD